MSTPPTQAKRERLEARITAEQKALIQRAADLEGRTLTDFIVKSLQASAEEAIARHERIVLSPEASVAFVKTLLDPPTPSPDLRQAAKRYFAFRDKSSSS